MYVTRGDGTPARQPVEITVLDALARGMHMVPDLVSAVGEPAQAVDAAVTWAVGQGLATRMVLTQGEHITLTESGLASVALQRRLESAIGPDGEIDIAALTRHTGAAWQAAREGQAAELARSRAHVLVADAEREAAVASLQDHYTQGAIDLADFERRTALALAAHTRGDLLQATADLQAVPLTSGPALPPRFGVSDLDLASFARPGLGLLGSDWFTKLRLALLVVPVLMLLFGGLVAMLVALGA